MNYAEAVEQFRGAMLEAGLEPPLVIEPGELIRFSTNGTPDDVAGWCKLFPDLRGGVFGDHRTNKRGHWSQKKNPNLVLAEREALKRKAEKSKQQAAANRRNQHETAAQDAVEILGHATGDPATHPYALKKNVPLGPQVRRGPWPQRGWTDALLFPIYDVEERIWSIQAINIDGEKDFLAKGRTRGHFYPFGKIQNANAVYLGEGVATVAAAVAAEPSPAVAALSAGNLMSVALAVREVAPNATITIVADNDVKPDGSNPGMKAALDAARAVSGRMAIPELDGQKCDFWDVWHELGAEAVRCAICEASHPTVGEFRNSAWPEPKPIQASLHPVLALDPEVMLPDVLRDWIMDEADRMPCAPDFIAVSAIVALGSIIGAHCAIQPKQLDSWLIIVNLWGAIVAPPAAKKSPAIAAGQKPLDRLIAHAKETYQEAVGAFEAENTVHVALTDAIESRIKATAKGKGSLGESLDSLAKDLQGHRQQAPEAPTLRRYKSNDTTIEKLGELLRENPAGLLMLRDELVGLIASWEREGREGERAFYLESWNGNTSFDTDRIGRGSIFIPNLCVSIFGGIQPDKLAGYLEQAANALANDGMLQRFQMLVYPDHRAWEWRDRTPNKESRDRAFAVFEALANFDPGEWGAEPADDFVKFPHFRFDDAAQGVFIEWSSDLHMTRLPNEDNPIIAQHLTKYDKLFPALALIFHLVDCATTGTRGHVTRQAALRAAAWCEYLESHARRCYGLLCDDGLRAAQALADKVQQGKLSNGFTARDVRRNQWRNLTTDEAVQAALDWLEDEGWVRAEEVGGTGPGAGRRTMRHTINPRAVKTKRQAGGYDELA